MTAPAQKPGLHPRNKNAAGYDFAALTAVAPGLVKYIITTKAGTPSIDFANPGAVKAFNRALLALHYGVRGWEIYPWDQDKTWGYYDGIGRDEVFFDMPLNYGMAGARTPNGGPGGFAAGGLQWWRDGGFFSAPLLANPQFRKVFLARTKEILLKVYTKEVYFPLMDELADKLKEDVATLGAKGPGDPRWGQSPFLTGSGRTFSRYSRAVPRSAASPLRKARRAISSSPSSTSERIEKTWSRLRPE